MQDNKMPKVQVRNLTKKFGDLLVLNDISFDVRSGEFLCIVGPTGCGKTTFLNSLTKLYQPTAGEILLDGEPVDLKKHNIAYIFQEYSTMPWLTVEENVGFGLDIKGVEKEKAKALVNEYLDIVGLTKYRKYYPDQLSASMLQRVVIARAYTLGHDRHQRGVPQQVPQHRPAADGRALWPAGYPASLSSGRRADQLMAENWYHRSFHYS